MEAILSLLSTYELFNNIFPGIIFSYFLNLQNYNIIPNKIDIYEKLFLYYFIGLIISRIGSLFLEPFFLKLKIIRFADYSKFLKAEEKDNKIHMLVLVNNMYKSFCVVFLLSFFWLIYKNESLSQNKLKYFKSKTMISKCGRKILRTILYKISLIVVCKNQEIKFLYKYLITRKENPKKRNKR